MKNANTHSLMAGKSYYIAPEISVITLIGTGSIMELSSNVPLEITSEQMNAGDGW